MKAVLLLDGDDTVAVWQREALQDAIAGGLEIVHVAHCTDAAPRRWQPSQLGYAALVRASHGRIGAASRTSVRRLLRQGAQEVWFTSDGAPAKIPDVVARGFADADVVISLSRVSLRLPDSTPTPHGMLAYHFGDVAGRGDHGPLGLDELRRGADVQSVAVLHGHEDPAGGQVVAHGYARVVPHSYRQTVESAYEVAIPLLSVALSALAAGGEQTRLAAHHHTTPSNLSVGQAAAGLLRRKAGRLAYGLLTEKRWRVGQLRTPIRPEQDLRVPLSQIEPIDVPKGYSFAADPSASPTTGVYCEVLNARSGRGEIARRAADGWQFLDLGLDGGHASYPQALEEDGWVYLFPEIAEVSSPTLYRLDTDGVTVRERIEVKGLEDVRLVDATLFRHRGLWFIFAGEKDTVGSRLDLWVAPSLTGPYRRHSSSPICLDPRGARMAGPIAEIDAHLYRFGQDGTRNYGGRVTVHRIDALTEDAYRETRSGSVQISDAWGPHTISIRGDETWIDFFQEKKSPLAGVRRLKARYL